MVQLVLLLITEHSCLHYTVAHNVHTHLHVNNHTQPQVTEMWKGAELPPATETLSAVLEPHASLFVKLSACV
jgi:hypothetical protein